MSGKIIITLGYNNEFGIDEIGEFFIQKVRRGKVMDKINLGPATEKNLDTIMIHMGHLRIHTERN